MLDFRFGDKFCENEEVCTGVAKCPKIPPKPITLIFLQDIPDIWGVPLINTAWQLMLNNVELERGLTDWDGRVPLTTSLKTGKTYQLLYPGHTVDVHVNEKDLPNLSSSSKAEVLTRAQALVRAEALAQNLNLLGYEIKIDGDTILNISSEEKQASAFISYKIQSGLDDLSAKTDEEAKQRLNSINEPNADAMKQGSKNIHSDTPQLPQPKRS